MLICRDFKEQEATQVFKVCQEMQALMDNADLVDRMAQM